MWALNLSWLRSTCWTCLGFSVTVVLLLLSSYAVVIAADGTQNTDAIGWRDVAFAGATVLSAVCTLLVVMLERRIRSSEQQREKLDEKHDKLDEELRRLERILLRQPDRNGIHEMLASHVDPLLREMTQLRDSIGAVHRRLDNNGIHYAPPHPKEG